MKRRIIEHATRAFDSAPSGIDEIEFTLAALTVDDLLDLLAARLAVELAAEDCPEADQLH